ncbi:MAG: hypothetical protein IIY70_00510 [Oscillospiraceae bacterium]|nr:hypothetical protein [Oscillospiraceae bacterium]
MRQKWLAVPMLMLCLLCACGSKETNPVQAAVEFRSALLTHGGCGFTLEAQADSGEGVWALTLECNLDQRGGGTVTVLAPESIAGISAALDAETGQLRYQDLALGLDLLPGTELAPAAVPGRIVRAWAEDWIASVGPEGEAQLVCYEEPGLEVRTWFDAAGTPLRAELLRNGQRCFAGEIQNFEWKAGTNNETTQENLG